MNENDYIYQITSHIHNTVQRKQAEQELKAHFEDRKQFYLDCGYDDKVAEEKTIARLGNPDYIGTELEKVHSSPIFIISLSLLFGLLFLFGIYTLIGFFVAQSRLNIYALISEYFLLIICFLSAFIALKKNYIIQMVISLVYYALFVFGIPFMCVSRSMSGKVSSAIVYSIFYLTQGKTDKIGIISQLLSDIQVSPLLVSLSIIFYLFVLALFTVALVLIIKTKRCKYTLIQKRFKNVLCKLFLIISIVLTAAFCTSLNCCSKYQPQSFPDNALQLAVSDEKTDVNSLTSADKIKLEVGLDFDAYPLYIDTEDYAKNVSIEYKNPFEREEEYGIYKYIVFDKNIKMLVKTFDFNVITNKKYVYFDYYNNNYYPELWKEVENGYVYVFKSEDDNYPLTIINLHIKKQ